jgi:hypothetical protein
VQRFRPRKAGAADEVLTEDDHPAWVVESVTSALELTRQFTNPTRKPAKPSAATKAAPTIISARTGLVRNSTASIAQGSAWTTLAAAAPRVMLWTARSTPAARAARMVMVLTRLQSESSQTA